MRSVRGRGGVPGAGARCPGPGTGAARIGRSLPPAGQRRHRRAPGRGQPGRAAGPGRAGLAGPDRALCSAETAALPGAGRAGRASSLAVPVRRPRLCGPTAPRRGGSPWVAACRLLTVSCSSPPTAGLRTSLLCEAPAFPARQRPTPVHEKLPWREGTGNQGRGCRHGRQLPSFGTGTETGGCPSGDLSAGCPPEVSMLPTKGRSSDRPSSRRRRPLPGASTSPSLSLGHRRAGHSQDPLAR